MSVVPQTRLMIAALAILLPASTVAAVSPDYAAIGVIGCLVFGLLALCDVIVSRHRIGTIGIDSPAVLRMSLGSKTDLRIQIEREADSQVRLRLGLSLPLDAVDAELVKTFNLSAAAGKQIISWPLRGRRQGHWRLEKCYLEVGSRFGLWAIRQKRSLNTDIRIYPRLMRERRQLSGLFLNRGIGVHVQRQVGKGREFEQLRDYLPGDSMEDIHWKASARRNTPITKVYQIERTQQVYVVLDSSRLSGRRLQDPLNGNSSPAVDGLPGTASILERFTAATLLLALAAERQGDHFGLLCHDDRIRAFLPAKSGKGHFGGCRDAIYDLKTRMVSPDFNEVFTFIGSRVRKRALFVFLTSLDDPVLSESFSDAIEVIGRRHIVLVNMLKTDGIGPLFSGPEVDTLDDVYDRLSGHLLWRRIGEVERVLKKGGIQFALLDNASLCSELISRYLAVKRRQIL